MLAIEGGIHPLPCPAIGGGVGVGPLIFFATLFRSNQSGTAAIVAKKFEQRVVGFFGSDFSGFKGRNASFSIRQFFVSLHDSPIGIVGEMKVVAIAASESAQPPEGIVVAFISIGFSLLRFFYGVESVCVAKGVGVLREGAGVAIVSLGEQPLGVKRVAVDSGGARAFLHHFFHLAHSAIKIEFEAD